MSVLRYAALCDIQITHDLDTCDQGTVNVFLQSHDIRDDAIQTHTHRSMIFKRFDMDIRNVGIVGTDDQAV